MVWRSLVYFRNKAKHSHPTDDSSKEYDSDFCSLVRPGKIVDLEKIFRDLLKIPPLQLEERAKHYFGIQVKGFGTLSSVEKLKEDSIGITLLPESTVGFIRTAFSPDEYPGIGVVEHGAKIEIQGKITDIENRYGIYLSEAKLKF
ncbi:MAG: hypothetical protein J7M30_02435 [Deltaproteobacteria bacterium]|nr:hypothetical protein [Deltaproteobacteria bacterium]